MGNILTRTIPSFDPYDIKTELVGLLEDYFQTRNLDTYESGFMGYLTQAQTYLTSDMLFQNTMAYNEAFLNRAILPSSVHNIAAQLDYKPSTSEPAVGYLTVIVAMPKSNFLFRISSGSKVDASGIPYKVKNHYYVVKNADNMEITMQDEQTGSVRSLPYQIEIHNGVQCLVFNVLIWQVQSYLHEFTFENTQLYNFYQESVSSFEGNIYSVFVSVENEKYKELNSIYYGSPSERVYELIYNLSSTLLTVKFGNGVYGYLPKTGAVGKILLYTTLGVNGNIINNKAKLTEKVLNSYNGEVININSYNGLAIANGYDGESLNEIKKHTIENISAAKRLVTEADYKGFAGVTGLKRTIGEPVLLRRDVTGNDITFFVANFDYDGKPIPTASISAELSNTKPEIQKGEVLMYEGVAYSSPFKIILDESYDIPLARYFYSLKNLEITPRLFSRNSENDILMGIRRLQANIYPNTDSMTFVCEAFKLPEMDGTKMSAVVYLNNDTTNPIEMEVSQIYDDKVTVNLSTMPISISDPRFRIIGDHVWTIKLFWKDYKDVVKEYNTYSGNWAIFKSGEIISPIIDSLVTSSDVHITSNDVELNVGSLKFKYQVNDTAQFEVDIEQIGGVDKLETQELIGVLRINSNTYPIKLTKRSMSTYTFVTDYIKLEELTTGVMNWNLEIEYYNEMNNYQGNISVLNTGERLVGSTVFSNMTLHGAPKIELVHIGINTIVISETDSGNYMATFELTKMTDNSATNVHLELLFEGKTYNCLYTGETASNVINFRTPEIPHTEITTGLITFKINIYYKGELYSTYKQAEIFKQDLTDICYSNIYTDYDGVQRAYNIPVLKQSYYEDNKNIIDSLMLADMAYLREDWNKYKMLTDNINIKYVRTFGRSKNMLLNEYNNAPSMLYDNDFYVTTPPKIKVRVVIVKDFKRTIPEITEECRNVLFTFLQLKAGFHTNIYKSEIGRFLHDAVDEIAFCEILEPTKDIIYSFDLNLIPRMDKVELFKYCPEYIWFDKDLIDVEVSIM